MTPGIPTFAVVGAVNHGKSSAVAALLEDDAIRVSPMPGETVDNQRFAWSDLLVLHDTPGFQNARKALAEIDGPVSGDDPLQPFRGFIERHRDDPDFEAECRLLQPVVDGAGIIYVVDGSRPLRDIHLAEMEILRRTGAPRLAVINRTRADDHMAAWKSRLDQHFNIVRTFDAHRVTPLDRIDLIEALASIERRWKDPLMRLAAAVADIRASRIADTAVLIADLLVESLSHTERSRVDGATDAARAAQAAALEQRYVEHLVAHERAVHRRIIALHDHRLVAPDPRTDDLFAGDLFAEETWQLFGLGTRRLVGLSGVAGGLAGAGIDAATLGHSFGIGAVLGAATGAGSAWLLGKRRPELTLHWPTRALPRFAGAALRDRGLRFGGGDLVVGPFKAENFPWILLDRAMCLFAYVDTRSHARRDDGVADVRVLLPTLQAQRLTVDAWSDADRRTAAAVFRRIRSDRRPDDERTARLRDVIGDALRRVAGEAPSIVRALDEGP